MKYSFALILTLATTSAFSSEQPIQPEQIEGGTAFFSALLNEANEVFNKVKSFLEENDTAVVNDATVVIELSVNNVPAVDNIDTSIKTIENARETAPIAAIEESSLLSAVKTYIIAHPYRTATTAIVAVAALVGGIYAYKKVQANKKK